MKGLKITLWVCAIHFLMSFIFLPLPWRALTSWFNHYGVQISTADHWTIFWLRLLLTTFGMIGVFFPKYKNKYFQMAKELKMFIDITNINPVHIGNK